MATKKPTNGVTIRDAIERGALDCGTLNANTGQVKKLYFNEISARTRPKVSSQRIGLLCSAQGIPTLAEAVAIAEALHLSMEEVINRDGPYFPSQQNGTAYRLSGKPQGTHVTACRIASSLLLAGRTLDEIRSAVRVVYTARKHEAPVLDEATLRDMAHSGLAMGLARFETLPGSDAGASEDLELAEALEHALAEEPSADGSQRKERPVVRVIKNVAHGSFAIDPVVPFLISRVAHEIVAEFIGKRRNVYGIGLAGGMHCATFVDTAGPESSPFPDESGDKRITLVPLTLEPFTSHQLPMADVVVGKMVSKARCLLGTRRVEGMTLHSFGYMVDEQVVRRDDGFLAVVRQRYRDLDVAIYGCGDLENDGWLEHVMRRVQIAGETPPVADVCLNFLAENGTSIPLPERREFIGIGLSDIQRLVERPDRLALLLTSGQAKGLPIVAAARAGCAGTIVCDQAAARAALKVMGRAV